jgi:putative transposase
MRPESAVTDYVDWFNHRRLHTAIGTIPLVEAELQHYDSHHDTVRDRERATMSRR